jgi:regulator of protease activity HflC (stomatin/prohibitin superfamily)
MPALTFLLSLLVVLAIAALAWWRPASTTVFEYERGLLYRRGKFVGLMDPGVHWVSRRYGRITRVDMRASYVIVPGQELLSLDGVGVKVSLAANIQMVDPNVAVNKVQDYRAALYAVLQLACRDLISAMKVEDLLTSRPQLGTSLMAKSEAPIAELGVKLISAEVRDLMLPGDLKRIFGLEVQARKEGLAALERARGETAALRSLANAARLLQDNPALLQLRLLQTLGATSGNTIVVGSADVGIPINPAAKARGPRRQATSSEETPA